MNNLDKKYQQLLSDIIEFGVEKKDRTGTGTISEFGHQIRHKMSEGFPLLTTKKMAWKTLVTELLWFLRGDTNIKYLVDNNCHIWNGDAYKRYMEVYEIESRESGNKTYLEDLHMLSNLTIDEFIERIKTDDEFAKKWGELGPIYGKQWRLWGRKATREEKITHPGVYNVEVDQIQNLINELKTNPDSRRLMVNAWNVGELDKMTLPPCHYGFQVYTRELSLEERLCIADKFNPLIREDCLTKTHHPDETEELKLVYRHEFLDSLGPNVVPQRRAISLMWNQRSVDTFLGLPFNIASYGLLLEIIAKEVNMVPDELIGNLGDTHLYLNHIEQAKEQIGIELSLKERIEIASKDPVFDFGDFGVGEQVTDEHCHKICDSYSVPRKTREPFELPKLELKNVSLLDGEFDYEIIGYHSHPTIKAPLSN
jgi:thymidylate synthase